MKNVNVEQYAKLLEAHQNELRRRQDMLVEGWKTNIAAINKYMKAKHGREMSEHECRNVAQILENTVDNVGGLNSLRLFEAGTASTEANVAFLGMNKMLCAA